jgi:riboflavin synthase
LPIWGRRKIKERQGKKRNNKENEEKNEKKKEKMIGLKQGKRVRRHLRWTMAVLREVWKMRRKCGKYDGGKRRGVNEKGLL